MTDVGYYRTGAKGLCSPAYPVGTLRLTLRRLSPLSSTRWLLCGMRSRMASASVGAARFLYHRLVGNWLAIRVEPFS